MVQSVRVIPLHGTTNHARGSECELSGGASEHYAETVDDAIFGRA